MEELRGLIKRLQIKKIRMDILAKLSGDSIPGLEKKTFVAVLATMLELHPIFFLWFRQINNNIIEVIVSLGMPYLPDNLENRPNDPKSLWDPLFSFSIQEMHMDKVVSEILSDLASALLQNHKKMNLFSNEYIPPAEKNTSRLYQVI